MISRSNLLSDSEFEDEESHVTLSQALKRGNVDDHKSAIRLHELGPRITLELYKIESDLLTGEVLYHKDIVKNAEELSKIKKKRADKQVLKEQRRKQQQDNVVKKEKLKEEHKIKTGGARQFTVTETDKKLLKDAEEALDDKSDEDDAEYYRDEIGEKPEKELFDGAVKSSRKRPHIPKMKMPRAKKPRMDKDHDQGKRGKGKGDRSDDKKFKGKGGDKGKSFKGKGTKNFKVKGGKPNMKFKKRARR